MEKYIVTENTVQYFENGSLVWENTLNNDKNEIIKHLEECNADYEVLETITPEEQMILTIKKELQSLSIESDLWEDDYLVVNTDKYMINIIAEDKEYKLYTTNHKLYEEESNKRYGDTDKANANYKTYKSSKGVINYITKYMGA